MQGKHTDKLMITNVHSDEDCHHSSRNIIMAQVYQEKQMSLITNKMYVPNSLATEKIELTSQFPRTRKTIEKANEEITQEVNLSKWDSYESLEF